MELKSETFPGEAQPRRNDRNMATQHVVCVWPPRCDMLGVVGSSLKMVKFEPTTPNMLQQGGETGLSNLPRSCQLVRPKRRKGGVVITRKYI